MSDRLCSSASTCVDTPALFACSRENVRFPANNKWFRNLAVARIVAEQLESPGMKFPEPTVNIKEIARKNHHAELEEEKKIGKS